MEWKGRKQFQRTEALLCVSMALLHLTGASVGEPLQAPQPLDSAPVDLLTRTTFRRTTAADAACKLSTECNDAQTCTTDICSKGKCFNIPIPDCSPCSTTHICPPIDIVFVMDTSGSMRDEAEALCEGIPQVIADLEQQGVVIRANFLGITETPDSGFSCLTNNVLGLLGGTVPGDAETCPFPVGESAYESWGPATAIVTERFPWTPGATRLVVPISDEGPCKGSLPDGCNDPGDDRDSIDNAVAIALSNNVVISPITGTGSNACVINLANAAANGTGGIARHLMSPMEDLSDALQQLMFELCQVDDRCDDGRPCTAGDRCLDGMCAGTPIDGCRPCTHPIECDDENACTTDSCIDSVCLSSSNHDEATQCCNPDDGSQTAIDDGISCTLDVCDPLTGLVSHPPSPEGAFCDDDQPCTVLDGCNGSGQCRGTDVEAVHCISDADCFGQTCDEAVGFCACGDGILELCLNAASGSLPEAGCFSAGEIIFVTVDMGSSSRSIVGGQFLVNYDPTVLDFIGIEPGAFADPQSPFVFELARAIDEPNGMIFYAVGVSLGMNGTQDPASLARLRFRPLQACASDELCILSQNPTNTILVDDQGHFVPLTMCCTDELYVHGAPPALQCPGDKAVNSDPDTLSAFVTWPSMAVGGSCGEVPVAYCSGTNGGGTDVSYLASSGGRFPYGTYEFECTATDSCGASSTCKWTVEVRDEYSVEVDVQLSPAITSNPLKRCIVFEFFSSCDEPPTVVEQTLEFGGYFNFPGTSANFALKVPAGKYSCVTARDPKHTLRSVSDLRVIDGRYNARFAGDPRYGGNWLLGGNLNGDRVIDLLDHALLLAQYSASLNPNTPCGAVPGVHADINGSGYVDANDLSFIQRHVLATDKGACCPTAVSDDDASERSEVSLEVLDDMGLAHLRAADFNANGMVNAEEIMLFLQGPVDGGPELPPEP